MLPHLDAAYRFARWLSRAGDAEDLVQEAFLRAWRGFEGLRGGDVKAWLFTIVRNCHASAARERQRRGALPLGDGPVPAMPAGGEPTNDDPESLATAEEERRTLARVIAALPDEHREVLLLREMEDMSYREIAQVTQVPIGTVMSRLARARAALRGQWPEQVSGEPRAVR